MMRFQSVWLLICFAFGAVQPGPWNQAPWAPQEEPLTGGSSSDLTGESSTSHIPDIGSPSAPA